MKLLFLYQTVEIIARKNEFYVEDLMSQPKVTLKKVFTNVASHEMLLDFHCTWSSLLKAEKPITTTNTIDKLNFNRSVEIETHLYLHVQWQK